MNPGSLGQVGLIVLALVAVAPGAGCSNGERPAGKPASAARAAPAVAAGARTTVETPLAGDACRREVDKSDPNETPFEVCPGPSGYALVVRRVGSGRASADLLDPGQRRFPLDLEATVTRHMAGLAGPAHWRVLAEDGRSRPVALVLRVAAHEDPADPARVTRTLQALVKIDAAAACVVEVRPADDPPPADRDAWLDASAKLACAAKLPPPDVDVPRRR